MMTRPGSKATAMIPLRPAALPTTAAAPAPMNTNEKVPTNSARSLGAIRLDIVHSRAKVDRSARTVHASVTPTSPRRVLTELRLRQAGVKSKCASASQTTLVRLLRLHRFCDNRRKPDLASLSSRNGGLRLINPPYDLLRRVPEVTRRALFVL